MIPAGNVRIKAIGVQRLIDTGKLATRMACAMVCTRPSLAILSPVAGWEKRLRNLPASRPKCCMARVVNSSSEVAGGAEVNSVLVRPKSTGQITRSRCRLHSLLE